MNGPDIVIVGGSLVGASLALALEASQARVVLVESRAPVPPPRDGSWDQRVYAVSPGNRAFLEGLGVWPALDPARIAPIRAMRVWGDDGETTLDFDAQESGVSALGYIVENRLLHDAMWRRLHEKEHVEVLCPAQCQALQMESGAPRLSLADGRVLEPQLLVGADGANSWVRTQAGLEAAVKPYYQFGVVANFATEKTHGGVARQWFRRDGVLAWLPLPGNRVSIVWSAFEGLAQELMGLDAQSLCERVAEAGGRALGSFDLITPPAQFPLQRIEVPRTVLPGLALVGDAAHAVHPLAGQGVNLGFQDVRVLADILAARPPHLGFGDMGLLRRYERARREDVVLMQLVTDGLQRLFNRDEAALRRLRNWGLGLTDRQGWVKRQLMRHAMR